MTGRVVTPGRNFKERAEHALADAGLQAAMRNLDRRLFTAAEVERATPWLKDRAASIRRETLSDLDGWLDRAAAALEAVGVVVHRAATPADAARYVVDLALREGVREVVKSKSMATEEIDLADALRAAGVASLETDLGEYVVEVAGERPSHMVTPAIHKTIPQVAGLLTAEAGRALPADAEVLTRWVRDHLRPRFLGAEMGVTGANFVAADTGTVVLVTNEGNGRLCTTLPRIQVVLAPVDKVVPRLADVSVLLPLLTRSATGQALTNYVTMITGPRRAGELDGPEQVHVVLLDHNRRRLLGTPYEEMLACIRCGACLNVCPVYRHTSGHAYDSVYTGPMGKILTPLLSGGEEGCDLPFASTLCGACTEACPVEIPLADLLVRLRSDLRGPGPLVRPGSARRPQPAPPSAPDPLAAPADGPGSRPRRLPGEGYPWWTGEAALPSPRRDAPYGRRRLGFAAWAALWSTPAGYRLGAAASRAGSRLLGRARWTGRRVAGSGEWTATRDLPLPAARPFRDRWGARASGGERW